LQRLSQDLGNTSGNARWYDMSERIRTIVQAEKPLPVNVDF
jgi:citrate synthase